MKILNSLKAGFLRSFKSWKAILIVWFVTILLVSLVVIPVKSALSAGFGNSTITDQLKNGINLEVFTDLFANSAGLSSYFFRGFLMLILVNFFVNTFLTGGLFNSLRRGTGEASVQEFFRASARKFWSFLVISGIFSLIILLLFLLIIIIPVSLLSVSEKADITIFNYSVILSSLFLFVLIIILITADYSRAWQAAQNNNACFRAINFGFRETFRTFFSSYPLMLALIIIQILYMLLVLRILSGLQPQKGLGIIILFTSSQLLFFVKLFLKTARYGSITSLMESGSRSEIS